MDLSALRHAGEPARRWTFRGQKKRDRKMTRSRVVSGGLTTMVGMLALLVVVVPALGVGGNTAALHLPGVGVPTWRVHSDTFSGNDLAGEHFTVYTDPGGLAGAGFTHLAGFDVVSPFATANLAGVLTSQIWQHSDSHLLFAYQLENTGQSGFASMRIGNIEGYDRPVGVVDTGILHDVSGGAGYEVGDVLKIERTTDGVNAQLSFSFEATETTAWSTVRRKLDPGQTSGWLYVDTDQDAWHLGVATIQDGGVSHDQIPVLVPGQDLGAVIPEPLTLAAVLAGMGSLSCYIRRRRS
jgi:hypothetical protein